MTKVQTNSFYGFGTIPKRSTGVGGNFASPYPESGQFLHPAGLIRGSHHPKLSTCHKQNSNRCNR